MQRRIAKTFLQQALHTARRCNFFLGVGRFALSQALKFGLRLQRAASVEVGTKKARTETSPLASPPHRPNPPLRVAAGAIPAMESPSGTPPTPPYSIPPSVAAAAASSSVVPPPHAANPSDAGNPTTAA
jgi:hypothetical protein